MTENQNPPHVHFCPKTWKIPTKTKKNFSQEPFLSTECSMRSQIETSPGHKAKLAASTKCCGKELSQHSLLPNPVPRVLSLLRNPTVQLEGLQESQEAFNHGDVAQCPLAVSGEQLDSMGLEGFSSLRDSVILFCSLPAPPSLCPWMGSPFLPCL